jgi:uncharacterized RDD family membrane protein YckC
LIDLSLSGSVLLYEEWRAMGDPRAYLMNPHAAMRSVLLGGLAFVAASIVTCCTEGRWGLTPGKWIVGIRVTGTDFAPCGFPRAVLRSVLRLMDGQMNHAVGLFAVAFSGRWQRVGDLAAKTLVVRTSAARSRR